MNTVVILEGLNASGKTFCAESLALSRNWSVIRPFRPNSAHLGESDKGVQEQLRALGIPVNTYVDDIYVADFLVQTGIGAILDRSMASGIAYGILYGDVKDTMHAKSLLDKWQETLSRYNGKLLYVHIEANRKVRKKRCQSDVRWIPTLAEEKVLRKWFGRVFTTIAFEKMVVDTSDISSENIGKECTKRIIDKLR